MIHRDHRNLRRLGFLATIPLFVMSPAAPASAQSEPDKLVAAELFKDGLAKMLAGSYDTGCPLLKESYRRDPRPGTLFTLAECQAKGGLPASAVKNYNAYLELYAKMTPEQRASQKTRETVALAQRKELEPQISRLKLTLPESAPKDTVVKRDGVVLDAQSIGVAVPLDPGDYVVTTQAPGKQLSEEKVVLKKGEERQIVLKVSVASLGGLPPLPPDNKMRIAAYVAGGVGIAGVVTGAVTGGLVLGAKGTIGEHCKDIGVDDRFVCDPDGKEAADRAHGLGIVSTIAFSVGVGGLAAGAVLYFMAPSTPKTNRARRWVKPDIVSAGAAGAVVGMKGVF